MSKCDGHIISTRLKYASVTVPGIWQLVLASQQVPQQTTPVRSLQVKKNSNKNYYYYA
ncbi:MAG: hypothetical protein P9M13_03380 [Candidatus Ancaeobacter aquaticus]|nr:hypothetical protein [Candidatus Ancaeobacter aquaticus]